MNDEMETETLENLESDQETGSDQEEFDSVETVENTEDLDFESEDVTEEFESSMETTVLISVDDVPFNADLNSLGLIGVSMFFIIIGISILVVSVKGD